MDGVDIYLFKACKQTNAEDNSSSGPSPIAISTDPVLGSVPSKDPSPSPLPKIARTSKCFPCSPMEALWNLGSCNNLSYNLGRDLKLTKYLQ